jgi:heat induced stress protein YflT
MNAVEGLDTTARRAIAAFDRYEDAQDLVDRLADRGFPVERLTIVGRDPEIVERVTGRLDAGRATLSGAAGGAMFGALFGLLFAIWFSPDGVSALAIVLYWLAVATAFGALLGVVAYAFSGRRGFTSTAAIRAERYEVLVDEEVADQALGLTRVEPNRTHR